MECTYTRSKKWLQLRIGISFRCFESKALLEVQHGTLLVFKIETVVYQVD